MAQLFSMIGIMNAALLAQGMDDIISDSDGSVEFIVLSSNWPSIIEAELEDGAYYFTRETATLTDRSDGKFGFDDAYTVPATAIHVRRVWLGKSKEEAVWSQDGTHIFLNAGDQAVHVEYVVVPDTDLWSANFARGVQMKLEAIVLRSLKEEHREARAMDEQAETYFQRARTNSSKARSATRPFRPGRIARARFGRG